MTIATKQKGPKTREDDLLKMYDDHSSMIIRNSQYIGYGILIALFHFGQKFFLAHKIIAILTALSAISSLTLIYIYSVYMVITSENILVFKKKIEQKLKKDTEHVVEEHYQSIRPKTMRLFWCLQISLIVSAILFIVASSVYFYCDICEQ